VSHVASIHPVVFRAAGEADVKPIYEKLVGCPDDGVVVKEIHGEACNCPWQYPAEVELVVGRQSQGYRIVGDNIRSLQRGDLVLLGANLPHAYQHTDPRRASSQPPHSVLLQFAERDWIGLFELPAMAPIRRLLRRASQGLEIVDPTRKHVSAMLLDMLKLHGAGRIAAFIALLDALAQSRSCHPIASSSFRASPHGREQERVGRVCQFIDQNCHRPLNLGEVAKTVHLSEGAFSRFFRAHVGKTFPAFVNDLRIGRACRLLTETEMGVTEIALICGYQNLSNFNRQFLRLKGIPPGEFRRRMV